jgi:hypothetical protein
MDVARDVIHVALAKGGLQHVANPWPEAATGEGRFRHARPNRRRQMIAHLRKDAFNAHLPIMRTTKEESDLHGYTVVLTGVMRQSEWKPLDGTSGSRQIPG